VTLSRDVIQGLIPKEPDTHLDSILAADATGYSMTREFTQIGLQSEVYFLTGFADSHVVSVNKPAY
jgi:hypothetical protein